MYGNSGALGKVSVSSCQGAGKKMELYRKTARPGAKILCQLFMIIQKVL